MLDTWLDSLVVHSTSIYCSTLLPIIYTALKHPNKCPTSARTILSQSNRNLKYSIDYHSNLTLLKDIWSTHTTLITSPLGHTFLNNAYNYLHSQFTLSKIPHALKYELSWLGIQYHCQIVLWSPVDAVNGMKQCPTASAGQEKWGLDQEMAAGLIALTFEPGQSVHIQGLY